MTGTIIIGQIDARLRTLYAACNRCSRMNRYRTDRLLEKYGPDFPVPELRYIIAADCPRMIEGKIADPCGVHFPGLTGQADLTVGTKQSLAVPQHILPCRVDLRQSLRFLRPLPN